VGVGAHVEVLGALAQEQVAHAAAHQVGQKAVAVQAVEHLEGVRVDVGPADAVVAAGDDLRLGQKGFRLCWR
jgi:hypothetical protein